MKYEHLKYYADRINYYPFYIRLDALISKKVVYKRSQADLTNIAFILAVLSKMG
ncbi:hypothetical protein PBI_121Q_117 [Escherichia phage 121Q]|uniref:Uncharacterized protein n=1 Tax=Escherichia phage 121Q TaxID=1555202 RepID=A0A097EX48_9CAUD|nr:hypothetical protein PBI_121Q_117 [Escherichia phage 121Q]AIT14014.1 hypothetical protein PBI_121Q_117 [Escherichia phage 121Q]